MIVLSIGLLCLSFDGIREASDRPSILFIVVDDLNNDLSIYDHPLVKSPNIERLADRGIRFDRAYCQYPVCNPSRSSMLTGLYPEQSGVLLNSDSFRVHVPDVVTLPQWFRQHGYFTARVGKIFHYGVPNEIGTDGMDDPVSWDTVFNPRGIDREVHDQIHTLIPGQFGGTLSWLSLESSDGDHTDGLGATHAIRLLEDHHPSRTGKPFFLAVGFYRPHTPFVAPSSYFEGYPRDNIAPIPEYPGDRDDIPVAALADRPFQLELTEQQRREIIQAYYASVTFMDAQVGRLLDALESLDLTENTIVVLVSDHGYHLGHHGLWQKGDLFEGSSRVPLVIVPHDNRHAGEATGAIVELVDLYPTLLDLSGLPEAPQVVGSSLKPILDNPDHPGKSAAFTQAWSRAGWTRPEFAGKRIMGYSVRTPRFRYTEWAEGRHGIELYDHEQDAGEYINLAGKPDFADVEARLKQMLRRVKKSAQ